MSLGASVLTLSSATLEHLHGNEDRQSLAAAQRRRA